MRHVWQLVVGAVALAIIITAGVALADDNETKPPPTQAQVLRAWCSYANGFPTASLIDMARAVPDDRRSVNVITGAYTAGAPRVIKPWMRTVQTGIGELLHTGGTSPRLLQASNRVDVFILGHCAGAK